MPSTYTGNLGIELPADGELDGVWGDVVNDNMNIIDRAINGSLALALSGTSSTLTTSDGSLSDGQYKLLVLGGTPSGTHTITIAPSNAQKIYFVRNTTAQSVVFTQGSGGNVTVATGDSAIIYSDGAGAGAAVVNITNDFAMNSVKITGGTIDGTVIGGTSAAAGTFTTANATTVDTTNIEVTTLKAKDGTSAGSIADSTGVVTLASSVLTTTDINGGTIDGTAIGGTSAAAGAFTTVAASGQASFADGSAAAPSITNTGDLNAGLFFPASDTVAVSTAGTERVRIDSAGNVGIGTTTPSTKLDVVGEVLIEAVPGTATSRVLRFNRNQASVADIGQIQFNTLNGVSVDKEFGRITGAATRINSGIELGDVYISTTLNGTLREVGRFTSAGSLVIGNGETSATPTNGVFQATGGSGTDIVGATLTVQGGRGTGTGAGGPLIFSTAAAGTTGSTLNAASERMRIDSAGNVGIGTSSPSGRLHVEAGSVAQNLIASTGNGTFRLADSATGATRKEFTIILDNTNNRVDIQAVQQGVASRNITLNAGGGNVGIGTTAPAAKLEVALGANGEYMRVGGDDATNNRALRFTSSTATGSVGALHTINASGSAGVIALATASTERMRIDSAGNVGIGLTAPTNKLHIISTPPATVPAAGTSGHPLAVGTTPYGVAIGVISDGTGYIQSTRWDGTATNYNLSLEPNGGNVGVGTSSPEEKLVVEGASPFILVNNTDETRSGIRFADFQNIGERFQLAYDAGSAAMCFDRVESTGVIVERMRITGTGVVYIGNGDASATPTNSFLLATAGSGTDIAGASMTIQGGAGTGTGAGGSLNFSTAAAGTTGSTLNAATTRMTINSAGNVGIGTTSPSRVLSVASVNNILAVSGSFTLPYTVTGAEPLRIGNFANTNFAQGTASVGAAIGLSISNFNVDGGGGSTAIQAGVDAGTGGLELQARQTGAGVVSRLAQFHINTSYFFTANTERMRINASGNVGIGETAPLGKLHIRTGDSGVVTAGVSGDELIVENSANAGVSILSPSTTAGNLIWGNELNNIAGYITYNHPSNFMLFATNGTERMRIDSSGNVGIGTSSPTVALQIGGVAGGNRTFQMGSAGATRFAITTDGTNGLTNIGCTNDSTTGALAFQTGAALTERLRIDPSGNVGIGNTAPVAKLHVTGASMTTGVVYKAQPAQTSKAAAATLTIAELLTGIVQYTGALATLTLPTGTDIEGGVPATFPTDMSFDVSFINTGAGLLTIGANGNTTVGTMTVATLTSAMLRFRKTAANTYTVYRIS